MGFFVDWSAEPWASLVSFLAGEATQGEYILHTFTYFTLFQIRAFQRNLKPEATRVLVLWRRQRESLLSIIYGSHPFYLCLQLPVTFITSDILEGDYSHPLI